MRTAALLLLAAAGWAQGPRLPRSLTPEAPPVIAHAVEPGLACTSCHGDAYQDGIPGIPHAFKGWCQSCHLPQSPRPAWKGVGAPETASLRRLRTGMRGARTAPHAPPSVPHAAFGRERCQACHGATPRPGMRRNPHPQRPQCWTCHTQAGPSRGQP